MNKRNRKRLDYDNAKHAYEALCTAKKPDHTKTSKVRINEWWQRDDEVAHYSWYHIHTSCADYSRSCAWLTCHIISTFSIVLVIVTERASDCWVLVLSWCLKLPRGLQYLHWSCTYKIVDEVTKLQIYAYDTIIQNMTTNSSKQFSWCDISKQSGSNSSNSHGHGYWLIIWH